MKLSTYNKSDIEKIKQLFTKVFSDSEGQAEGLLIGGLVYDLVKSTDSQDIYGFVAIENNQIIGTIIFTRMTFESDDNAFLLSPVAILTNHQGKGVGQKLIKFGIQRLKEKGVKLVFTYGDPDFYSKVGFRHISEKIAKAPLELTQPEGWLCQSLVGDEIEPISGSSYCVEALNNSEYW
ncbi:MAG: N-acetyltransferase [Gammaproteobacteria bacterium]|nr:N-acetyltransferase [Gammaproteobacteria bacterium]